MKLGRTFLGAAHAPLGRSSERFSRNLIGDGVRALSAENLMAAVDAGVSSLAGEVGMSTDDVARVVPMDELRALAAKAGADQDAAIQAIRRNDLTITNFALPTPTASPTAHLEGLAQHFARDKHIRRSLTALAGDIGAWEQLLARAAEGIEGDAGLVARWRWRKIRVYVLVGLAATLVVGAGATAAVMSWRSAVERREREAAAIAEKERIVRITKRVDAALATPDPCAAVALSAEERAAMTDAQRATIDGRKGRCEQIEKQRAHEQRCAALASQIASGSAPADAGGEAPGDVAVRLAAHALEPGDLRATPDSFGTCKDAKLDALWDALARESSGRAFLWGKATGVSPFVAERVGKPEALASAARQSLGFRAEVVAKQALRSGKTLDFSGARELCGLKAKLGMAAGASCKSLGAQGG